MSAPYRWNAQNVVWEFHEPAFGGWTTLRYGPHVSTRPMTFTEGIEYLVIHPLVRGREEETYWIRDAIQSLAIGYYAVDAEALESTHPRNPTDSERFDLRERAERVVEIDPNCTVAVPGSTLLSLLNASETFANATKEPT